VTSLSRTTRLSSTFFLPSRAPELNPVENVWQYLRHNWLSNTVFENYIRARYDDQGLFELARPIPPPLRSAFLQAVAAALATSSAVGPGAVHRVAAELQKRFTLEPLAEREP
jgi:hypothetical protein